MCPCLPDICGFYQHVKSKHRDCLEADNDCDNTHSEAESNQGNDDIYDPDLDEVLQPPPQQQAQGYLVQQQQPSAESNDNLFRRLNKRRESIAAGIIAFERQNRLTDTATCQLLEIINNVSSETADEVNMVVENALIRNGINLSDILRDEEKAAIEGNKSLTADINSKYKCDEYLKSRFNYLVSFHFQSLTRAILLTSCINDLLFGLL